MFLRRHSLPFLAGQGVLLSVVAILLYTNPVSAQQASPGASQLTAPALTAAAAANAVELRWDAVPGAVRYELWTWWDAETGWQQIGGDSLTGASYTHTGVTAGRKYYYTIRAVNAAGEKSGWQQEYASATVPTASVTPVASPLTAPKLTAAAVENAIELRWDAVSGAVRYELWTWWDAETGWQQIGGGNLTGASYTHTGVTAGRKYYYTIRAVNAAGETGRWQLDYPSATLPSASIAPDTIGERAALVALYNATGGASWKTNTNWLSDKPLGEWHGVTTDDQGRVTALNLGVNQLSGQIPSTLGSLANLTVLDLSLNQLSGSTPPELGNLANLTSLGLGFNQLRGTIPSELGNLANLTELDLRLNQLSGSIPPELGNLANLTRLTLQGNQLSGSIPPELGNLANLTRLTLSLNRLSGAIPSELGNLANLTRLTLGGNQLSGQIPSELGNLTNLTGLHLGPNKLSGQIPSELGNLANLTLLNLDHNQLSGQIPSELGNLTNLTELSLINNQLSGQIPSELGNLTSLTLLNLYGNQLSGQIPSELGNLADLKELYLGANQLSGQIPSELGNLTNLAVLLLAGNQLNGCAPAIWHNIPYNDLDELGLPFCST